VQPRVSTLRNFAAWCCREIGISHLESKAFSLGGQQKAELRCLFWNRAETKVGDAKFRKAGTQGRPPGNVKAEGWGGGGGWWGVALATTRKHGRAGAKHGLLPHQCFPRQLNPLKLSHESLAYVGLDPSSLDFVEKTKYKYCTLNCYCSL
jgi:hypothetical protein